MARKKKETPNPVVKLVKHPGMWSLYLVKDGKTGCLVKNTNLETFLNYYFQELEKNILKHPDIEPLDLLKKYQEVWKTKGKVISVYLDSWDHKWVCFPSDKKILNYLTPRINDLLSKQHSGII